MPVARAALRISAMQALLGNTIVGERVYDSELGPIETWVYDEAKPVVIVYTDDATFETGNGGPHSLLGGGDIDLVLEIAMTQKMKVRVEGTGEEQWVWDMPETDAAMEMALELIARQVIVTLMSAGNDWSEMWKRIALNVGQWEIRRGNSMRDGVRFAGLQLKFPVTVPRDPAPGQAPARLWTDFLALVNATPDDFGPVANVLAQMISPDTPNDWRSDDRLKTFFGMTDNEMKALMLHTEAASDATIDTLVIDGGNT